MGGPATTPSPDERPSGTGATNPAGQAPSALPKPVVTPVLAGLSPPAPPPIPEPSDTSNSPNPAPRFLTKVGNWIGTAATATIEATKTAFNGIVMLPVLVFKTSPAKTSANMLASVAHGMLPLGFAFAGAGVIQATTAAQGGDLSGGQAICVVLGCFLVAREVVKAVGARLEKGSVIDLRKASNHMLVEGMFGQELDTLRDPEFQKKCAAIRFNHWIQYIAAGTMRSFVTATTGLAMVVATIAKAPDSVKWAVGVATIVPLITTLYLSYRFVRDEKRIAPLRHQTEVVGNYLVHIDTIADLLTNGGRPTVEKRKIESADVLDDTERNTLKRSMWFNVASGTVGGVAIAYSTFELMKWVAKGGDLQTAFIIGGVISTVTGSMVQLVDSFAEFMRMAPFIRGLRELWNSRKVETPQPTRLGEGALGLQVSDVCYGFGKEGRDVLAHVNLVVKPGEFIIFKGTEGCGKSTLFYVMAGVTRPKAGSITVISGPEAVPLNEVPTLEWRECVSFALQEAKVYDAHTIRENILMGRTDIELMERLIEETGFGETLRATVKNEDTGSEEKIFPDGLDTVVAAQLGGRSLSGGQKKLIALVRALMKRPKMIFLDETLNDLSEPTCTKILGLLKNLTPVLGYQPTILMISHHSWHDDFADRVLMCSTKAKGIESETSSRSRELWNQTSLPNRVAAITVSTFPGGDGSGAFPGSFTIRSDTYADPTAGAVDGGGDS